MSSAIAARLVASLVSLGCANLVAIETNVASSAERYYRGIRDTAKWGQPTNGIQLGVAVPFVTEGGADKFRVDVYLLTTNSSIVYGLVPAPAGHRLDLALRSPSGEAVKRSKQGDAISQTASTIFLNRLRRQKGMIPLAPGVPVKYEKSFFILECFKVKKPGAYILEVKVNLYKISPDKNVLPLGLPPVTVEIPIRAGDLKDVD